MNYSHSPIQAHYAPRQYNFTHAQPIHPQSQKFPTPKSSLNSLPVVIGQSNVPQLNAIDVPNKSLNSLRTPTRNNQVQQGTHQLYRPAPPMSNTNRSPIPNNSFEANTHNLQQVHAKQQNRSRTPNRSDNYAQPRHFNSVTDFRATAPVHNAQPVSPSMGSSARQQRDATPVNSGANFVSPQVRSPMKRGKSPLHVFVMNDRNEARRSVSKTMDKEEKLQRMVAVREAEITELRREVDTLKQGTMNYIGDSIIASDNPAEQYNKLKDELQAVQFENQKLKEAMNKQERDFKKQLFDIKLRYEENARKNIEAMQRELVFQYANNDNESIKVLKETIQQLESKR